MMNDITNEEMMKLDPGELEKITGGDAYDTAEELARYMDWLMNKYNCYDALKLKQHLTPEEKARIRELRSAVFAQM